MKLFHLYKGGSSEAAQGNSERLPVHPVTLFFPPVLEKPFRDKYLADVLPMQRVALLSGALLYALFAILDELVVPGQLKILWLIRFAIVSPLLIACFCLSFSAAFRRYSQVLMPLVIAVAGLGVIAMAVEVPAPANYLYYAGLFLVIFYLYTFSGVLFTHAVVAGLFIVFAYEIVAIWVIRTPFYILTSNNFFFISASCLGMLVCYSLEKGTRRNFYLAHLLEQERAKVTAVNLDLARQVEDRGRELEKTHRQLVHSEKLATAGLLAASIVHEFGSPIFAIRNFLENLQQSAIPAEDRTFAALAVDECNRLSTLLGSLRDFHRPTSGRKEEVELDQLLDDIVMLCGNRLQSSAITLEKHYGAGLPCIKAVRDQLKQVALNLLTNAIDAVSAKKGNRRVKIGAEVLPETVVISFEDNGEGIAPHLKERIFEPFVSNKDAKIGTGLGLAIAYGIVRAHGGTIEAANNDGPGACFKVALPHCAKEVEME